jgi:hypothetical protein
MIPFVISSSWVFSLMAMHWVDNFSVPKVHLQGTAAGFTV